MTSSHVLDAIFDDVLLNHLASLSFPASLVVQVLVTFDVVELFGLFLLGERNNEQLIFGPFQHFE